MSNLEILKNETLSVNFNYTGENLFTYGEWKSKGYQVKKGEKAFLRTRLWKKTTKYNKTTNKQESFFVLVPAYLFTIEQVEKVSQQAAK